MERKNEVVPVTTGNLDAGCQRRPISTDRRDSVSISILAELSQLMRCTVYCLVGEEELGMLRGAMGDAQLLE